MRTRSAVAVTVLLFALFCLSVSAADIPNAKTVDTLCKRVVSDKGTHTFESKEYIVECKVSPRFAVEAGLFMDDFFTAFRTLFGKERMKITAQKPKFIIWDTEANFLSDNRDMGIPQGVLGFFSPQDRMLRAFVTDKSVSLHHENNSLFRQVVQHEATHQLLFWLLGRADIPFWFNEGTADYFGSWNAARPSTLNRDASFIDNIHIHTVWNKMEKGTLVDILYFTGLEAGGDFQSGDIIYHYGCSYAFISFLLSDRVDEVKMFNQLWDAIKRGKSNLQDEFFSDTYMASGKLQERFNKYLVEWYSYYQVRFAAPWEAPVKKLEFLAEFLDRQDQMKGAYRDAAREVIAEYTGKTFADAQELTDWLKNHRDYLAYACKKTTTYKEPKEAVDPFYHEYAQFGELGGLFGTLTLNTQAEAAGVPACVWEHVDTKAKKEFLAWPQDKQLESIEKARQKYDAWENSITKRVAALHKADERARKEAMRRGG